MQQLILTLSNQLPLSKEHIKNIIKLLEEGATIPFIARYRKEMTGGATDIVLRELERQYQQLQRLQERKEEIKKIISERATLTSELQEVIDKASTLQVLEDIYRPYKEQKNTRATQAIKRGLQPLALTLKKTQLSKEVFLHEAKKYIKGDIHSAKEAIIGAQDIIAGEYAQLVKEREAIRNSMLRFGRIITKPTKYFKSDGVYKNLANKEEKLCYIPSHRFLAIMRAVKEKELSLKIVIDTEYIESNIKKYKIPKNASSSKEFLFEAYRDGLKRLLLPSIEREVLQIVKEKADIKATEVFGKNLSQLLLTPPLVNEIILGVDPAFRSGCKLAVIDAQGTYLDSAVIYPTEPKKDYAGSLKVMRELVKQYKITVAAIGNGTASRETQAFFTKLNNEKDIKIPFRVVSEAGASVYSASKIAQEEYPELDVTIRGAISIAQRLQDPMAAYVKIDPKSLGVGQYQHDVDQKLLQKRLEDTITDTVNRVGVDINSASSALLSYIAGISKSVAKNIVQHKEKNGTFKTKEELLKVKGVGKRVYEQAAGFIRIKDAKDILDNTGVHPESYPIAKQLLQRELKDIDIVAVAKELGVGEATLRDIVDELQKPGFDPREDQPFIPFKEGITDIEQLKEGDRVSGVVRNITEFGAFVDIGLKNDGMIHISKMADKRVSHPLEVLALNQFLPVIEVISIDLKMGKVGLSLQGT